LQDRFPEKEVKKEMNRQEWSMSSDLISRRAFLLKAALSLAALNFGCSISKLTGDRAGNTAIVYATKYGATKDTADWIRNGIVEEVDLLNIEDISFPRTAKGYGSFIIGSGVWVGGVHNRLLDFLTSQSEILDGKVIASFIVCGTDGGTEGGKKRISGYFDQFHTPLKRLPLLSDYFGGRIIVEKLTEEDREALIKFYRTFLKSELKSWDKTDPDKAGRFGKEAARLLSKVSNEHTDVMRRGSAG
jgi:menaquinone-dependent protoporphyrinogen oxidase